ncbi:NAD+ synthase [Gimibacter soli]|uniref:Glutamine-dependent NAD(+) synthetase n=1 Tax=Gimibacter soli TaxID=3024400 RepID=A0AAE9XLA3_9PROT|nr:NAD+ synthase [Gimibacter soli]WCL53007.1 NAD+ synthase [Gimibacter soli]
MTQAFSIWMAQINPTVGAIAANEALIGAAWEAGKAHGADLVLTPELSVVGYPPEDLVLKPFFVREAEAAVERLAALTAAGGPGLVVGTPWLSEAGLHNAALLLAGGRIEAVRFKHELPNYGVFDEKRVFAPGNLPDPVEFRGVRIGLMVCEDMWFSHVSSHFAANDVDFMLVPNGSPFEDGKGGERVAHARNRVTETGVPLLYCNQLGGQDELVFDGASFAMDRDGRLAVTMDAWASQGMLVRLDATDQGYVVAGGHRGYDPDRMEGLYQAMILALRDYVGKNRFPGVILGMSGGIDSALSAAVAVDALGADAVHCVMMPSRYTSGESHADAKECAEALGARYDIISIAPGVEAMDVMLAEAFKGSNADTTEENVQSRLRGVTLMALSNKFGKMVLTTGNKSEMSVGYATLYGDMCGGYNILKDVYKMDVFALARWRNAHVPPGAKGPGGIVIPENIISKPPTAELRPDQKDEDSLPPYEALDDMLRCLVDEEMSVAEVVARGHDASAVARIEHLLYIAEYKRRQAPPGVKLTRKNFGRDRRYPITNGFRSARRS